jgi:hypothetical protein
MRRCGFTKEESENDNKQRCVRKHRQRLREKAQENQALTGGATVIVNNRPPPQATMPTQEASTTIGNRKRKKGYNLSSSQLLKQAAFKNEEKKRKQEALIEATQIFADERKKEKGKTSVQVATEISAKYHTTIYPSTIRDKVCKGEIGVLSVSSRGPKGNFTDSQFKALKAALSSFIALSQANCEAELKRQDIINILTNLLEPKTNNGKKINPDCLYVRLTKACSGILLARKESFMEARRLIWTTYRNLDVWYENFKAGVVEYGFATAVEEYDEEGNLISEVTFTEEQKRRIFNIDETKISLDGSDGGVGGRPASTLTIKNAQRTGTATSKSSTACTMVCGICANGDTLPPHIQYNSDAQDPDNYGVRVGWLDNMPTGNGHFGFAYYHDDILATFAVNEKGGMDTEYFFKYLCENIIKLFPDAADVPGLRVLLKCDGGPGRLDLDMIAYMRIRGFYIITSVPNTTAVSQECDLAFGVFKSLYRKNLQSLCNERFVLGQPLSLTKMDFPILINGREASEQNGVRALPSPFKKCFTRERNLWAFRKAGACPLNRKALESSQVRRDIPDDEDIDTEEVTAVHPDCEVELIQENAMKNCQRNIEERNKWAVEELNSMGLNGNVFEKTAVLESESRCSTISDTLSTNF